LERQTKVIQNAGGKKGRAPIKGLKTPPGEGALGTVKRGFNKRKEAQTTLDGKRSTGRKEPRKPTGSGKKRHKEKALDGLQMRRKSS